MTRKVAYQLGKRSLEPVCFARDRVLRLNRRRTELVCRCGTVLGLGNGVVIPRPEVMPRNAGTASDTQSGARVRIAGGRISCDPVDCRSCLTDTVKVGESTDPQDSLFNHFHLPTQHLCGSKGAPCTGSLSMVPSLPLCLPWGAGPIDVVTVRQGARCAGAHSALVPLCL